MRNTSPAFNVPSVEGLRELGVSFLNGETLTLLSENGTPVFDETEVSVCEYLAEPLWFHYEVLAALRADPKVEALYARLRAM
ncbi:hypothetical protein [Deinococcus altitudinis]|uniref:hypothetical protein n=1 Tax=Deinococcus altitudinis TaxID=468914 RepID=UPI0038918866